MRTIILCIFLLTSKFLFAQCSDCKSLEDALKSPEAVRSLKINSYVNNVTLDSVPSSIMAMKNIEVLYLTDHNIAEIPAFIGELKNLKELSFGGNMLTKVPDELFLLTGLRELILFSNEFTEEYISHIKKMCKEKLPNTKLLIGN